VATPDPTRSETRLRAPAEEPLARASRPSVRPSAFGPPRPSAAPPPPVRSSGLRALENEITTRYERAESEPPKLAATLPQPPAEPAQRAPAVAQPTPEPAQQVPPDFAAALTSLRPAWRETLHARARPLFSIALFCCMLALSAVSLFRYALPGWSSPAQAGERARAAGAREAGRALESEAALSSQPHAAPETRDAPHAAPSVEPLEDRPEQILALLREGDRALLRRNAGQAEQAFNRILELDALNARAPYGLARVRLAQGNLKDAEEWIQIAIRRRPRRAAYHALYAEILTALGREDEALEERLKAAGGPQQPEQAEE
jgi:tetratricopeptide (TPR) repeat protein